MNKQYITSLLLPVALVLGSTQPASAAPLSRVAKGGICYGYANKAISQNRENIRLDCGYSGGFHSNLSRHYNWCMESDANTRTDLRRLTKSHTEGRASQLEKCKTLRTRRAIIDAVPPLVVPGATAAPLAVPVATAIATEKTRKCDEYAKAAVKQSEQGAKLKCGFFGSEWNSVHQVHYDWCLAGDNVNNIQQHTNIRNKKLKRCGKKAKKEDREKLLIGIGGVILGAIANNAFNSSNNSAPSNGSNSTPSYDSNSNPSYSNNGQAGDHTGWCSSRYRSYRVSDNTFQPYVGPRRQCNSPYN
jgi:hypothetical protein